MAPNFWFVHNMTPNVLGNFRFIHNINVAKLNEVCHTLSITIGKCDTRHNDIFKMVLLGDSKWISLKTSLSWLFNQKEVIYIFSNKSQTFLTAVKIDASNFNTGALNFIRHFHTIFKTKFLEIDRCNFLGSGQSFKTLILAVAFKSQGILQTVTFTNPYSFYKYGSRFHHLILNCFSKTSFQVSLASYLLASLKRSLFKKHEIRK
jgi:hypothetical protein